MLAVRRILLTGGSGFVARHLIPALRSSLPGVQLFADRFDLTDPGAVGVAVQEARPDACIHLAGVTAIPVAAADPGRAWQVNLHGTLNLARAVLRDAPDCRFVHVSTAEAYGRSFTSGRPLNEAAPLAPMNV